MVDLSNRGIFCKSLYRLCAIIIAHAGHGNGYILNIFQKNIYFSLLFRNQSTINQKKQFQHASEAFFLSSFVPIERALPTGVLTEEHSQREGSPLAFSRSLLHLFDNRMFRCRSEHSFAGIGLGRIRISQSRLHTQQQFHRALEHIAVIVRCIVHSTAQPFVFVLIYTDNRCFKNSVFVHTTFSFQLRSNNLF